mmetsp:Transcript_33661/g.54204  ORF Transcript_33661/g.54204 Transcript_33661/m.54204 type:complete len:391 (+) Transcript_33661:80-1252(+)
MRIGSPCTLVALIFLAFAQGVWQDGNVVRGNLEASESGHHHNFQASDVPQRPKTYDNCLVTMITGERIDVGYALGALTLGHSFRKHTKMKPSPRLILIHDQEVGKKTHTGLKSNANMLDVIRDTGIWDEIREMPPLPGTNDSEAMNKYASMLFKLNAWRLDDCKRVLWMGTDSIVVRNIDELFTPPSAAAAFPHTLSVPDMGYWSMFWLSPAFNGDFIVFHPSPEAFRSLNSLAKQSSVEELVRLHKPPGPMDQGVLNKFYGADIHLLPWFYSIEAIGIVNIFRRNAKERAFGDTLAEHLLLDNDDSLPQTKLLGRDIPSVEWRWGDDRPFQGEDWLGPNQIRALMMLKNMKRWKTIHYAHHAMKPWRKDRKKKNINNNTTNNDSNKIYS